jgi:YidC/Oxa1 family membrane protein insertase
MNTQEKIIAGLLAVFLVGWLFYSQTQQVKQAELMAEQRAAQQAAAQQAGTQAPEITLTNSVTPVLTAKTPDPVTTPSVVVAVTPSVPEVLETLVDDDVQVTISSHGAVVKSVQLNQFSTKPGKLSDSNPPLVLDFAVAPALALSGLPGVSPNAPYTATKDASGRQITLKTVTAQQVEVIRRIELLKNYQIAVSDTVKNLGAEKVVIGTNEICIGVMYKEASPQAVLSVDSLPIAEKPTTKYWGSEDLTKTYLLGGSVGGCGGSTSAAGMPETLTIPVVESQKWVAIKSRFFVSALTASEPNSGFSLKTVRDLKQANFALTTLSATMVFPGRSLDQGQEMTRNYTLFVGPKKLSLLRSMGNQMQDIMAFGFFSWFCEILVPTLNFFHSVIPNYGVAILLLTLLVRIIFWPLTHKSTVSMKKMQELQPKLKEIQAKFKDNPTKMQQETWACYKANKVNPLSSCLPMLIQIPVFIALFTVLQSAVELRYAPFLWIGDLSEPENLFFGMIPFIGAINILPVLMAGTMALQTYLTPSAGDPAQQKMMMIMMPIMMLFMFYSFPSALSLYWTVSQVLSIVQMLMIRRTVAHEHPTVEVLPPEESLTRQQRRAATR